MLERVATAAQLTLLNQSHMAAFILILLVTYMELLALRNMDLAPPLVPLLLFSRS